ncbi:MAG: hypothetical protein KAT04_08390, partial [Methylococcales bacterium]|nr:hypothetical protein [Methylococcales bacterium]
IKECQNTLPKLLGRLIHAIHGIKQYPSQQAACLGEIFLGIKYTVIRVNKIVSKYLNFHLTRQPVKFN